MTPVILAAAESSNPILPSVPEIIWSVISFALLVVLLAKWAYPPVKGMMQARTAKIQGDIDGAENARTEAERVLGEYREQLAEARREATRIIEEARKTAEVLRRDLLARAEEEAADLRARNDEALAFERERVAVELRAEMAKLAVDIAERVIRAEIDRRAADALVQQFLAEIGAPQS